MSASEAIRAEIARRRKKFEDVQALFQIQIEHLEKTLEMLEEGESVGTTQAIVAALRVPRPASAPLRSAAPAARIPDWFAAAEAVFADGESHHVGEVIEAVKPFGIERKAVSVWLSRRVLRGQLLRTAVGQYQLSSRGAA